MREDFKYGAAWHFPEKVLTVNTDYINYFYLLSWFCPVVQLCLCFLSFSKFVPHSHSLTHQAPLLSPFTHLQLIPNHPVFCSSFMSFCLTHHYPSVPSRLLSLSAKSPAPLLMFLYWQRLNIWTEVSSLVCLTHIYLLLCQAPFGIFAHA